MSEDKTILEATSPEQLEEVEKMIKEDINNRATAPITPMNRKQRRALQKKLGKRGRAKQNLISETAKKIDYIDLIQKLRKLNAEKEKENGENETVN